MKIVILSFYSGYVERGVENWTHELASFLPPTTEVTVYQSGPKLKNARYISITKNFKVNWEKKDARGTLIRKLFLDYWSRKIAFFTISIIPHLIKENPDIIIPTNGGWQVAIIRLVTWLRKKKMIVVGHSGKGWDERNNLWSFPDVFVALTEEACKWAKKVNPLIKVVKIPDAVNTAIFAPKGAKAKVPLKPPIVLAVGALEKSKQLDLVIKAVSKLQGVSLLILGKGSEETNLNKLGKKLLRHRFLLTSAPYKNIADYYRASNMFTLPSWENEAFGMVYLEALATGLPVVAPSDDKRREIVGEAGELVDPSDTVAYTKAIENVLRKNWDKLPQKQAEKYSWKKVSMMYQNLFNEIV